MAAWINNAVEIENDEIEIEIDLKNARARTGPCLQGRVFAKF